jgi:hypothetical protein
MARSVHSDDTKHLSSPIIANNVQEAARLLALSGNTLLVPIRSLDHGIDIFNKMYATCPPLHVRVIDPST